MLALLDRQVCDVVGVEEVHREKLTRLPRHQRLAPIYRLLPHNILSVFGAMYGRLTQPHDFGCLSLV